jgi:hypothetical protein
MRKFSRLGVPHSFSGAQKVALAEAPKEMMKILQKSETNDLNGIATGEESGSQHTPASSKMFARSAVDIITRTRQAVGTQKYDQGVLHRKEIHCAQCSSKRSHVESAIFHQ